MVLIQIFYILYNKQIYGLLYNHFVKKKYKIQNTKWGARRVLGVLTARMLITELFTIDNYCNTFRLFLTNQIYKNYAGWSQNRVQKVSRSIYIHLLFTVNISVLSEPYLFEVLSIVLNNTVINWIVQCFTFCKVFAKLKFKVENALFNAPCHLPFRMVAIAITIVKANKHHLFQKIESLPSRPRKYVLRNVNSIKCE